MGGRAPAGGGLRLALLAFFAAGLLLIPAAQASADFTLTINFAGTGEGRLECEVETEEDFFVEECVEGEVEIPEGAEVRVFPEEEFGSEFIEFFGDCGQLACELTMDDDHEFTVVFDLEPVEEFALTINEDGAGSGEVECQLEEEPEPCASEYPEGADVTLIPVPDPGSKFVEFFGDCGPATCELTMNGEREVTVTFELIGPVLTITKAGTGSGTVKCSVESGPLGACDPAYPIETELTLVASANSGSQFAGWSGACTEDPCELTLEEDTAVTATFNLESTSGGGGGGTGGGSSVGTITKTPAPPPGKLSVSGAALYQGGKAVLKLSCKGQGPCKGSLKLMAKLKVGGKLKNIEIGKASFSLAAGASTTLKVKLAGAAKKVLGKAKNVKATVSGTGVTKSTVTIKPTAR
jgi:Divergent InlB B-repeat domain